MNRLTFEDIGSISFDLPPEAFDFEWVALDTEWFGQQKNRLHRPHGKFGSLACTNNGSDVYIIFDETQIQAFMDRLNNATHVWHNAQYDYRQLRKYANIPDREGVWDTMLIEQIRYSGYYDRFALNDLTRRYLNLYLDKSVREEFSDEIPEKMTDDQIYYAALDVIATWHVAQAQKNQIDEDDLSIWNNIEKPFLWTLLASKGIYFNAEKWLARAKADEQKAEELDAALPFNPRSPKQVKEYFQENYKLKLENTNEKILQETLRKHPNVKEIEMILTARGLSKAASTYGPKWSDAIEADGRIYPSWKQIGAETGRMSADGDIPIQTMPHDDIYRSCITCPDGSSLVINDYSSQEPRILAYITQDEKLIEIFKQKKDIYIAIGYEIFGEHFDKKDPRRQQMKSIILGVTYGMSIYGLAEKMGVDEDTANEWMQMFLKKFPGVAKWMTDCQDWKPYTTTILGRKFWGNPYKNGWERNYQNMPMQGSAVDCTKIAASTIYKRLGYSPTVIFMHDELVMEFEDKENIEDMKQVVSEIMVEVQEWVHEGIPGGVESFVGKDWSIKK